MKIFFQIWNVLLFIAIAVPAGILLLKAVGVGAIGSGVVGVEPTVSDLDVLVASLSMAQAVTAVIMTIFGFMGKYGKCSIIALIVLVFGLTVMLLTHNIVFAVVQGVMIAVYICLDQVVRKNQ